MTKKKYKSRRETPSESTFWLLVSVAGGILFSFGLLDWFAFLGLKPWMPVVIGAAITLIAIIMKKYRTETSFALGRRK